MIFDWVHFFETFGIEHILGPAPNVRRSHVAIHCPRCPRDTKHHFAIDLRDGKVRGCWRDSGHWMPPTHLIHELTGVSYEKAREMLRRGETDFEGTTAIGLLRTLSKPEKPTARPKLKKLKLPSEFSKFSTRADAQQRKFVDYLRDKRGVEQPIRLAQAAKLRWCTRGDFANRIIFPIRLHGKLYGWTSRHIGHKPRLRYRAHPEGDAMQSLVWVPRTPKPGDLLLLVEGPVDALKIMEAAPSRDFVPCALLTNSAGDARLETIIKLAPTGVRTGILLDRGAESMALHLQRQLSVLKPQLELLPKGVKDPGEMSVDALNLKLWDFLS